MTGRQPRARRPEGIALLGLLVLVALMGAALASVATVWHTQAVREREQELLFEGQQFRDAIASYVLSSPGAQQYPKHLEDLLQDPRFPNLKRHLRRIYVDPFTGEAKWGLIRSGDVILGVYSLASGAPIKQARFPKGMESFADARSYADWKFVSVTSANVAVGGEPSIALAGPVPGSTYIAPPLVVQSPDPPRPPLSPEQERRRQQYCNRQLAADKKMCQVSVAPQSGDAVNVCLTSAEQRYTFCANQPSDGSGMPPLDTTGGG